MRARGPSQVPRALGVAVAAAALLVAACAGENGVACRNDDNYTASASAPPVRVPDDLSIPDESEALTIPSAGSSRADEPSEEDAAGESGCLAAPPDYFEGGAPQ